jgi:CubicO group peptidase (beta-lactamase class C family)
MPTLPVRLAAIAALYAFFTPAWADDALDARIARVEKGLAPPFSIQGRPVETATIAQRMAELNVPGVSIAVINHGKIEWARAYGVMEAGSNRPVTTETLFQAASISKPVTALAALHLVEQGKLALDEDVNKKLLGWKVPAGAQTAEAPVTLRNLLSHTAGTTVHGFAGYAAGQPLPTLVQLLDGAKPANSGPVRVDLRPDTTFRYSGGGYSIAQLLMTSVSGKDFVSLMSDSVLAPLDMKRSTYAQPLPAALQGAAASGHDGGGAPLPGKWHTYPEQAAAGLWTTPSDLARFVIALQEAAGGKSDKLISHAMATRMLTKVKGDYGIGIEVRNVDGQRAFRHNGVNRGFQADMYGLTDGGQGVVVMTNGDRGGEIVGAIMRSVASEYQWKDMRVVEKPVAAVSAATLARYAGNYQLGPMTVKVVQDGERLLISAPPLGPQPRAFVPSSQTAFFNIHDWLTVDFEANQSGSFDLVVHADTNYRAPRIP